MAVPYLGLGVFLQAFVFSMPFVGTLSALLWRCLGGRFIGWDRVTSHRIFESRRREDESQADRFSTSVLQTYPSVTGDKRKSPGMQITLLIAEPDVCRSALDQQYFILI
jgi:hypothetical protein